MTAILGLNAYHGDSSACLILNGRVVAAAEEERFRRQKHWAGFPAEAIRYCLTEGGLDLADLDHIAINRDPKASRWNKVAYALRHGVGLGALLDRVRNGRKVGGLAHEFQASFGVDLRAAGIRVHQIEHHRAHLGSAFLVSPFERAALLSVDGFGDFKSTQWGVGSGTAMEVRGSVSFPHSLGLMYLAVTQYLGFWNYGDEYKVMGLAPYGEPAKLDQLRQVLELKADGGFALDLDYFLHHKGGVPMTWEGGSPRIGRAFSSKLEDLLGPARSPGAELDDHHRAVAASMQRLYEEALFHILGHLQRETGETNLCLAGGCGMNSVANGKILESTDFEQLYVQPAAGDAGGALGAAAVVHCEVLGLGRLPAMDHAYLGPGIESGAVAAALEQAKDTLEEFSCVVRADLDEDALIETVADALADGQVVGWCHGRMEWGPRALGARSILGDPRRADLQAILNEKVKRRESFRPFAPAILRERTGDWFVNDGDVPFMQQVWPFREEVKQRIPAVVHVDGTGRLQTVTREANPRYYRLIEAFERRTGVPILVNTSFNENEPVVCRPEEALDCFLRTRMDVLVLGDTLVMRQPQLQTQEDQSVPQAVESGLKPNVS